MRWRGAFLSALLMAASAMVVFHFFQRQLSIASFAFGTHPDVRRELELSLDDQKRLAQLDPGHQAAYRDRFDRLETTAQRLRILDHSRDDLVRRYETLLLALLAGSVLLVTGIWAIRQNRSIPRLERLQTALGELAQGRTDIEVGDRRRDTIGRIAAMVERTSKVMARDRRRLASLQNLSAWQEAARRHAHEMRTPLTGAQLELERIEALATGASSEVCPERSQEIRQAARGAAEELARLKVFTRHFTSFARLPRPQLVELELSALIEEFVTTFGTAWPNLSLRLARTPADTPPARVAVDRDMLRQVLVNLCDNSSQALNSGAGTARFTISLPEPGEAWFALEVADDGPGIAPAVRSRLFEPYTTTRTIGEGMGLGLAICKKIMLDHGGDLELAASSSAGTTFRITLPPTHADHTESSTPADPSTPTASITPSGGKL